MCAGGHTGLNFSVFVCLRADWWSHQWVPQLLLTLHSSTVSPCSQTQNSCCYVPRQHFETWMQLPHPLTFSITNISRTAAAAVVHQLQVDT